MTPSSGAVSIEWFLEAASKTAAALARFHLQQPVHGALTPGAIATDRGTGATRIEAQRDVPAAISWVYGSPEHTGRLERPVDARSDLYSLGMVFFEWLTGKLPFEARDPLEWVHGHLAIAPKRATEVAAHVPPVLSELLAKLLAKDPDERYQTAASLTLDLQHCEAEWRRAHALSPFTFAANDASDRFLIPQRLYGRDAEVAQVMAALQAVKNSGQARLVLLAGESGVGKSALVRELAAPLARAGSVFSSGKFDQLQPDVPYAPIVRAFRHLTALVLASDEKRLAEWRDRLSSAVGQHGQLLVSLLPEMQLILGAQPALGPMSPAEAHQRFARVMRRFIAVFATEQTPLTLFLDDLQWADAASLKLLEDVATHPSTRSLLLVGAYRSTEVPPDHVLEQTLARIRGKGTPVDTITLGPLSADALARLVGDTLRAPPAQCEPLLRLLSAKTGGNPLFFTRQFAALHRARVIRFDEAGRTWSWNFDDVRAEAVTDNVVDLLTHQLEACQPELRHLLSLAACVGNGFDAATLAALTGSTVEQTTGLLSRAVDEGLLLQGSEGYRFLHDRIQQAAAALIGPAEREATHAAIGRVLVARLPPAPTPQQVFEAVSQLNRSPHLLTGADERTRAAELNLTAARHARTTTAFQSAADFAAAGLRALGGNHGGALRTLAFSLMVTGCESALALGRLAEGAERLEQARRLCQGRAETATCWRLQIELHTCRGESLEALGAAFDCLSLYDVSLSTHPAREDVDAVERDLRARIGPNPAQTLEALPLAPEPDLHLAVAVLVGILPSAYYVDRELHRLVVCTLVDLALRHGVCPLSPMGFAAYALELAIRRDFAAIEPWVFVARRLVQRHGFADARAMVLNLSANCTMWTQDASTAITFATEGMQAGLENGDMVHAALCAFHPPLFLLTAGVSLDRVAAEAEANTTFIQSTGYEALAICTESVSRVAQALQGRPGAELAGAAFEAFRARSRAIPIPTLQTWVAINELFARVVMGDGAQALAIADAERPRLTVVRGQHCEALFWFSSALAIGRQWPTFEQGERARRRAELDEAATCLDECAASAPANFGHQAQLVRAVVASIDGRPEDASRAAELAIVAARQHGVVHVEALAHEFLAQAARARGQHVVADLHLREAHGCALRWGAVAWARALETAWPTVELRHHASTGHSLDTLAVVRASQAISSELALDALFQQLLRVVMQQGGAQRGALVLDREGQLVLAATGVTEGGHIGVTVVTPFAPLSHETVPTSVVHSVQRSLKAVRLGQATRHETFSSDPYIVREQTQSLLCLPIVRQGALQAVLLLENNLIANAFTPERLEALDLLATQLAISLENALLVADLRHEMAARKHREEELRRSEDRLRQSQKLEAIGLLAGGIAHDFNNLLTIICSYSQLALDRMPSGELHDDLEEVLNAGMRAGELTRQLLAFSRKQVLAPRPLDLNAVISNLDKMLRRLIGENIVLVSEYTPTPGVVRADPGQIEQVVVNLVVNARDAMPGGGRLTLSTSVLDAAGHPTLADGRWFALRVKDTGHGMSAETQARIFEPFFTTKETGRGTGLGLSTVFGIVQQSGGTLEVDSAPGVGTTFTVWLPQVREAAQALSAKPVDAPVRGGSETVLLVEDDATVRSLARSVLTRLGYDVQTAADGVEALDVFARTPEPIDLLITDTVMPRMGGPELARRLRGLSPRLKLLFLSGYAAQSPGDQATFDLGLFLQKPFTPDALARVTRQALDRR
ncbi:MAG: AAA family ATPase [Archangiaceae bacterium]|nr:AAA family ATPase [Archangiaceae bacterium]